MLDPYAGGVLVKDVHERLVMNLDHYASEAGIQPVWITRKLSDTCSKPVIEWTSKFKFHGPNGSGGLLLTGNDGNPEDVCSAIAGCLTRNFVRCRVMTLNQLIAHANGDDVPDHTCLLVPNFHVEGAKTDKKGAAAAAWRVQSLLDALVARHTAGLQTVLYVADPAQMRDDYGEAMEKHLQSYVKAAL